VALGHLCHRYSTPYQFHRRLARFAGWGRWPLIEATKAWRQWLCTAARDGASRDLRYSCRTAVDLAEAYLEALERDPSLATTARNGADERETGEEPRGWTRARAVEARLSAAQPAAPADGADDVAPDPGWFAGQLSKALVRATEEAARAGVSWRNLDELLSTQEQLLALMVREQHHAEAGLVLQGIAETCCLAQQAEPDRTKRWFDRPLSDLPRAVSLLEQVSAPRGGEWNDVAAHGRELLRQVELRVTRTAGGADADGPHSDLPSWVAWPTAQ
jgi:hypothetical protein